MDQHTRDVLEIQPLLEVISSRSACSLGRGYVRALEIRTKLGEVEQRFELIRELRSLLNDNLRLPLGGLEDISELLERARLEGSTLEKEDWPRIQRFCEVGKRLFHFAHHHLERLPCFFELVDELNNHGDLADAIDRVFNEDGQIKDNASKELLNIRQRLGSSERQLRKLVDRLVREYYALGALQEDFAAMRDDRYVLPVKAGSKGKVKGIVHGSSSSGETFYIEPFELLEPQTEVEYLREEEAREIHRILLSLTAQLRPFIPEAKADLKVLQEIDGLNCITTFAWENGWNIPVLGQDGSYKLFNAHHPMLRQTLKNDSVPITMNLDAQDRTIVISGPNAGGKTTAMKTIALSSFLVQCGCPIPASADSRMLIFSGIFADIGDRQDLTAGLSTYSGHIRRMGEILRAADDHALVLLDELGTGTDPEEGSALAQALLEHLTGKAKLTVSTSHLAPLKIWAEDHDSARNASFALDPATHRPTYRVRLDLPGASEALTIAENEGLPKSVLEMARSLVGEQKLAMGELLSRIESLEQRLSRSTREAEDRAKSLQMQENLAQQRAEELRNERRKLKSQMLEEKKQSVDKFREEIETMIATLPSEEQLRQRRETLNALRDKIRSEQESSQKQRALLDEAYKAPTPKIQELQVGQNVFVRPMMTWAEILRINRERKKIKVLIGSVELDVSVDDLSSQAYKVPEIIKPEVSDPTSPSSKKKKKSKRSKKLKAALEIESSPASRELFQPKQQQTTTTVSGRQSFTRKHVGMELDLHGYRVEEAIAELDKYLDSALLADYPEVRIIHGLGQGKLYRAVHDFLKNYPSVRHFRFGLDAEGGGGVTVVKL